MAIAGAKVIDGLVTTHEGLGTAVFDRRQLLGATGSDRFAAALQRAQGSMLTGELHAPKPAQPAQDPVRIAANQPATATDATVSPTTDVNASERARKTLKLDRPEATRAPAESGDRILDGLQKLRGVFDNQQGKLNTLLQKPVGDATQLLALQVEVVNFSLLVDVTSKLTGKSTQALETLLKGQ